MQLPPAHLLKTNSVKRQLGIRLKLRSNIAQTDKLLILCLCFAGVT